MKSEKTKKLLKTFLVVIILLFVIAAVALIINSINVIQGTPVREITFNENGVVFE